LASENGKRKPLRVALIASEHTVCEYSIFLERLLIGLADESIPVALICPPGFNPGTVFTGVAEVINHPVFDLPLMKRLNTRLLTERLSKFEPTILHCLCESKASLTRQLARRLDLPYVLMVNSLQNKWSHLSVSSKHCAKIIVPAKSIAANMASVHPRFADLIEQINIGTFTAEGSRCFSEPSRLATMVMTDPLDKADDFEKLFSVIRHLMIDGYEFMTVVVGGGRAERQLWKLLSALGLLQIVSIVPRRMPWRSVLAAGDIFIQPKPSYSFDPVLLEAMRIGAAVAGCTGGVDDLIIEDRTAVVFDPNDEMSIMRTLQRLLDRREFARQIAGNAQQYLRENYSVSKMISATLQTYYEAQEQ
jgi:glycosyltransferase involved in cell wall biosynthesis